jgi:DNA-binding beta-propeller fold protein YncE
LATDSSANVYVADSDHGTIRKITPEGVVTTVTDGAGSAVKFSGPHGVAIDSSGNLFVAARLSNTIGKITPAGEVTILAGLSGIFGSVDGTGSAARFNEPEGVVVDSSGNVYVADSGNHTIRKITPAGVVTTLAGLAGNAGSADGTRSAARFAWPAGVAIDSSGNVYVADLLNATIRKIDSDGVVTTVAGLAGDPGSADGTGSAARFGWPAGVAIDSSGNLYVADAGNRTIRKINPAGVVTTVAGVAGAFGNADGTGNAARFSGPQAVAIDSSGNVYVADAFNKTNVTFNANHTIRKGSPALSDIATIDQAAGLVGATRVLDTEPQSATSWEWTIIRQPGASNAALSSATVRNPTFTPDVADLYQFRLVARGSAGSSISVVSLQAGNPEDRPRRRAVRR